MARRPRRASGAPRPTVRLGVTGLRQYGGYVREEFLKQLSGRRGAQTYREMRDNDDVIGAMMQAVEGILRACDWTVEPVDSEASDDIEAAEFVAACKDDLEPGWNDTLADILSFLTFGWSLHEIVYKRRADGLLGWAGFPIRSQESLLRWEWDDAADQAVGMWQLPPAGGAQVMIPFSKALLFRTTTHKNNPEGRALDPQTPIPTPDGWRVIDDLAPGDKVFDEEGRIRYVVARADWENRPCYAVRFAGGEQIVADAEHQWLTQSFAERNVMRSPGRVRTTEQLARKVKTKGGHTNYTIPWAAPLDYPEQHLPISPYVLGQWLGDGTAACGAITSHVDDAAETAALVEAEGYTTCIVQNGRPNGNGRLIRVYGQGRWAKDGLAAQLRILGLIGNKHVPTAYLRSSASQRLALLAGLMDSDGHVDGLGRCEFSNTNYELASATAELVRSLGIGAYLTSKSNSHGSTAWLVKFTPEFIPFRLSRKAARCKATGARKHHYIAEIKPVEPRRTVCIEVDGPSNLFLAGLTMIPTHNSALRSAYRSWYFKKHIEQIEGIGVERDLAGMPVMYVPKEWTDPNASADVKALFSYAQTVVRDLKRDEQEGLVLPSIVDPETKQRTLELTLLSTGGRRQQDTGAIIARYSRGIAGTLLADFLLLGHDKVGSFALSSDKSELFEYSLNMWADAIAEQFTRKAIPDLLRLNGMPGEVELRHGPVEKLDLRTLGEFVERIIGSGAVVPDEMLETMLRQRIDLPEREDMMALPAPEPEDDPAEAA